MKNLILILLPLNLFSQVINFKKTNVVELKSSIIKNEVTLFYLWGTWCKPCVDEVPDIIKLSEDFKNLKLILINDPSSNKNSIQKILKNSNYKDSISYILDDKIYNKSVKKNFIKFTKEFCKSCAEESGTFINPGVYLFDKKAKLLFYNKEYDFLNELREILKNLESGK